MKSYLFAAVILQVVFSAPSARAAAQLTWQLAASVGLEIGKRIYFTLGYRVLYYDTVTGDGDNRNGTDFLQHGPVIGAGFSF